ncbi:MAG TPA: MFS transporter, partial [Rubricoccaceae bacterium]
AFGERRLLVAGLALSAASHLMIAFASAGWMLYAALPVAALGGVAGPAAQAIVTRRVGASEQGGVQGALASLSSLAAVVAPPLATALMAHYTLGGDVPYVPGASFIAGGAMLAVAAVAAFVVVRRPVEAA